MESEVTIHSALGRFMTISVKVERNTKGYNCEVSVSDAPTPEHALSTLLETLDKLEAALGERSQPK